MNVTSPVTPVPKEGPSKEPPSGEETPSITVPCGGSAEPKIEDAALGYVTQVLLGEYLLPELLDIKTVLDIGANVGAFALWARQMWPGCELDCYEPMPETFAALQHNLRGLVGVRGHRFAVTEIESPVMRKGVNTSGEDSIHDLGCQHAPSVPVKTVKPCDLPRAEFVKIDTEGCEVEIVRGILQVWKPKAFALEWHSYDDRIALRRTLRNSGYKIGEYPNAIVSISKGQHIGIMKAVR